jgi:hypothetical protein
VRGDVSQCVERSLVPVDAVALAAAEHRVDAGRTEENGCDHGEIEHARHLTR